MWNVECGMESEEWEIQNEKLGMRNGEWKKEWGMKKRKR